MLAAMRASGYRFGIYTSSGEWSSIFGSNRVVLDSSLPLWFARWNNDKVRSFQPQGPSLVNDSPPKSHRALRCQLHSEGEYPWNCHLPVGCVVSKQPFIIFLVQLDFGGWASVHGSLRLRLFRSRRVCQVNDLVYLETYFNGVSQYIQNHPASNSVWKIVFRLIPVYFLRFS
jgi:hypothetical protein